jgi:A/G-specific adenine glycosylase
MLQQTTVAAVTGYFERWMNRFPTVRALAAAGEDDVLALWQGLGYYRRARNLHRAARILCADFGGVVPRCVEDIERLPGVGEYTARAIAAFAFDAAVPVIDANIARVLARLFNITSPIDTAAGRSELRSAASVLLPKRGGRTHASALMDLGALVCTPRNPRCTECPVKTHCRAGNPSSLPVKRARPATERITESCVLAVRGDDVFLERSRGPRWAGLWVIPATTSPVGEPTAVVRYPITRYVVTMRIFVRQRPKGPGEWFPIASPPAMPSPHRRALAAIRKALHS